MFACCRIERPLTIDGGVGRLTTGDALKYLEAVKDRFQNSKEIFDENPIKFLDKVKVCI